MSKRPKKMTKERKKDLAKRFNAPEDKVAQFAGVFEELDKDNKGMLDKGALLKAATKLGFALLPEHADMIIRLYKTANKVGIDMDRFVVTMLRKMKWGKEDSKKEAEKMFKSFDKNGDGYLSAKELREGMEKLGDPMTDEEAQELMKMADKNKDGKVSYDEFLALWKQYYN